MATPSSSRSRPTSHFCSLPMHGGPKSMFRPYYPDGISLTDPKKHFTSGEPCRAYNVQHFRDNIRKSHPPALFLDDTVLVRGSSPSSERFFHARIRRLASKKPSRSLRPKLRRRLNRPRHMRTAVHVALLLTTKVSRKRNWMME